MSQHKTRTHAWARFQMGVLVKLAYDFQVRYVSAACHTFFADWTNRLHLYPFFKRLRLFIYYSIRRRC